jgi:GNAT superfamily N-acetyltransferase
MEATQTDTLEYHPATAERWQDLEKLFGPRGAYGGCWCMWWRIARSQFSKQAGESNKQALKHIIDSGEIPGILAYANGEPVGWCSLAPREAFPSLERSRTLKRVDDQPVWSIVCFYVARPYRGKGLMVDLLKAAIAYAKEQGATIIEGYPVESHNNLPPVSNYMGIASAFRKAGFVEVERRSEKRPIMRYTVLEP